MIRQWWNKVGRRFRGKKDSSTVAVQDEAIVGRDANGVVPLRKNPDMAVIRKKDNAELFTDAMDRLVNRLEEINAGISLRVQQNEQLLEKMNQLPDYLSGLPQHTQKQSEILQELVTELKSKSSNDQKMLDAVADMTEQAAAQSSKLGSINEHLQFSNKTELKISDNMERLGDSMNRLNDQSVTQSEWIGHLSRSLAATDQYVKLTLARQQSRFMWVFAISMAVCMIAVVGLIIGIWLMNR